MMMMMMMIMMMMMMMMMIPDDTVRGAMVQESGSGAEGSQLHQQVALCRAEG
jgi:competence protein ComGC